MSRRPKPNFLKLVTASDNVRPSGSPVPATLAGAPDAPDHLSPGALDAWNELAPVLDEMGIVTKADFIAIARLAELIATVRELQADINANGMVQTVTTVAGGSMERARPQWHMLSDADRRLRVALCEFGLTAASRSKVQPAPKIDEHDEYFGNPKRGA